MTDQCIPLTQPTDCYSDQECKLNSKRLEIDEIVGASLCIWIAPLRRLAGQTALSLS
jgi:hypothetical protein